MSELPSVVRQLPGAVRDKFKELVSKSIFKASDFDSKSLLHLQTLPESSQLQVLTHLESHRQQLHVARSKSAFLVSLCERARRGALDIRGFGVVDVFSAQLDSLASKFPQPLSLVPEDVWASTHPGVVTVVFSGDGLPSELVGHFSISDKVSDLKLWLDRKNVALVLHSSVLRDACSLAFYNFRPSEHLLVKRKQRGGRRVNKVE